ncbi:MAG: RloB domain-containing protein [Deltaproteobacteria bacterium]|nr:RloB domain-containing protein [Deltaproteobacteria bacterium]
MSLTHRKPRPLRRHEATFRDDRLFIVACDDTYAPKQYFDFFEIPRVKVHVVPTEDTRSAAQHVLNRLLQYEHEEDDELWLVLDTDHYASGSHLPGFITAISEAKQRGVNIALSKPCFEIWLLLHHLEETSVTVLADASEVEALLRATLGEYNKKGLKAKHYPIENLPDAIIRAERLDATVEGGDIPDGNTSRIYLLWKAIIDKALPSQLPDPLAELKQ